MRTIIGSYRAQLDMPRLQPSFQKAREVAESASAQWHMHLPSSTMNLRSAMESAEARLSPADRRVLEVLLSHPTEAASSRPTR
jgi:hypothetical protein